jgi:hypothetical protein
MSSTVTDLREHLFAALKGLKDGTLDVEKARAMSDVAQTIINSAKVEVEFVRAAGTTTGTGFMGELAAPEAEPAPAGLPKGITGVHVHRMR